MSPNQLQNSGESMLLFLPLGSDEEGLNRNPDRDLGQGLRVGYDQERAT